MKTEHLNKCEFVSVDFRDVASVKMSYKKLLRACVPGILSNLPEHSFNKLVDESGWLVQVCIGCNKFSALLQLLDGKLSTQGEDNYSLFRGS